MKVMASSVPCLCGGTILAFQGSEGHIGEGWCLRVLEAAGVDTGAVSVPPGTQECSAEVTLPSPSLFLPHSLLPPA